MYSGVFKPRVRNPWFTTQSVSLGLWAVTMLWSIPATAETAVLHVYGPEGSGSERRAIAVIELANGQCAGWTGVELSVAEEGGQVVPEDANQGCARWIQLSSAPPTEALTLRATGSDWSATATVAMGTERGLLVVGERYRKTVVVTVRNVPEDEFLRVTAYWRDGTVELEQIAKRRWRGHVPRGVLLGVVARSGTLVGAAAISPAPAADRRGPEALIMPSEFAVPAGGAPRTAAYLVVADDRGILSKTVSLRVTSERGALRVMHWELPGLAKIGLSAEVGIRSIDLQVSSQETLLAEAELAVVSSWPMTAMLTMAENASVGEDVAVHVSGAAADGSMLETSRLRVRCAGELREPRSDGRVACPLSTPGVHHFDAIALVDGLEVPLDSATIEAIVSEEPIPEAPTPTPTTVMLGALVRGGFDLWLQGDFGAGLRLDLHVWRWLEVSTSLLYGATPFTMNSGTTDVRLGPHDEVSGTQHSALFMAGPNLVIPLGRVAFLVRIDLGVAYVSSDARYSSLDESGIETSVDASSQEARFVGDGALGARFTLGRFRLGTEVGTRWIMAASGNSWPGAPVAFFAEVSGSVMLR